MTGRYLTPLVVQHLDDQRWKLTRTLRYQDEDGTIYEAKRGTMTDFGSIPRIAWSLIPKSGKHAPACVTHDDLCQRKPIDSDKAHAVFHRALKACGVSKVTRNLMYWAVKAGGPNFKATATEQ